MVAPRVVNFYDLARDNVGPLWAGWLGGSILALLFTGLWRVSDPRLKGPAREREYVPLLGLCAFTCFVASLLVQLVFFAVRHPQIEKSTGKIDLAAGDLAVLGVLSNAIGWAAGVLLVRGGGAVAVIGYQLNRFAVGLRDGLVGIGITMPFVFITVLVTKWLWSRWTDEPPVEHELLQVMANTHFGWVRACVVLAAVLAAPLFEELLFRGFIQGSLRRLTGSRWIAVITASVLFASLHDRWTIPPIFVLSLFLGFAYERKQNLWTSTVMHAMFNAFNIVASMN